MKITIDLKVFIYSLAALTLLAMGITAGVLFSPAQAAIDAQVGYVDSQQALHCPRLRTLWIVEGHVPYRLECPLPGRLPRQEWSGRRSLPAGPSSLSPAAGAISMNAIPAPITGGIFMLPQLTEILSGS